VASNDGRCGQRGICTSPAPDIPIVLSDVSFVRVYLPTLAEPAARCSSNVINL
jgi:hypothetical protein